MVIKPKFLVFGPKGGLKSFFYYFDNKYKFSFDSKILDPEN